MVISKVDAETAAGSAEVFWWEGGPEPPGTDAWGRDLAEWAGGEGAASIGRHSGAAQGDAEQPWPPPLALGSPTCWGNCSEQRECWPRRAGRGPEGAVVPTQPPWVWPAGPRTFFLGLLSRTWEGSTAVRWRCVRGGTGLSQPCKHAPRSEAGFYPVLRLRAPIQRVQCLVPTSWQAVEGLAQWPRQIHVRNQHSNTGCVFCAKAVLGAGVQRWKSPEQFKVSLDIRWGDRVCKTGLWKMQLTEGMEENGGRGKAPGASLPGIYREPGC